MSTPTKFEFKAEIKKVLGILSKSLYQHKEIFLRELLSNSSDALKRIHFISLQNKDIESADAKLQIEVVFDAKLKTIIVRDTGVGMTKDEIVDNLGTIAGSGTEKFIEQLKKTQEKTKEKTDQPADTDMIGQFGVGFYSIFMVAERVKVISKSYLKDQPAVAWESEGSGEFTIEPAEKTQRGTEVIIYLREDESEYLSQYRLEGIIKKYSNFVPYPIFVIEIKEEKPAEKKPDEEKKAEGDKKEEGKQEEAKKEEPKETKPAEPKPVNEITPLWKRPAKNITTEDYKNFYHLVARRWDDYAHVINFNMDGRVQFRSIIFVPESRSQDLLQPDVEYGLSLYSKNIMIIEQSKELIPQWMRFLKGMVDSEDIPLNVSRDTIQTNRVVMKIKELVENKVINELKAIGEKEPDKYKKIWKEYRLLIKEGIVTDHVHQEDLLNLLRFQTTKAGEGKNIGLQDYLKNLKPDQKEIYYLIGENVATLRLSPHLGYYEKEGIEVVLFDEPVDNFLMMNVHEYKVKTGEGDKVEEKTYPFISADTAEKSADKAKDAKEGDKDKEKSKEEEKAPEIPEETKRFLDHVKAVLGEKIIEAKISNRLYGNPCRLANPPEGMTSSMQRAMRYYTQRNSGRDFEIPRKILEFNPEHPLVKDLIKLHAATPTNGRIKPAILQLFANCLLSEGDLPNPSAMVPRINQILEMLVTGKDDVQNPAEDLEEKIRKTDEPENGQDGKKEVDMDDDTEPAPESSKDTPPPGDAQAK